MKRFNKKENLGITLIALVITVIILLILAGVTIGFAINGSGLFEKAKYASEEYNNKAEEEMKILGSYENEIDSYINGNRDNISYNYSLDEKIVGTWIDGKPVYQVTIKGVTPSANASQQKLSTYGFKEKNVDIFVEYSGIVINKSDGWCEKINSAWAGNQYSFINLNPNGYYSGSTMFTGEPGIAFLMSASEYQGANFYLTILYTKTTDTATRVIE